MATRKRRTTSPTPPHSPPRKQPSHHPAPNTTVPTTTTTTTTATTTILSAAPNPPALPGSVGQSAEPALPPSPLPAAVDANLNSCPFTLTSPHHNLLLTLLTQSGNTPHPWIKCHKCGKWRKLPPTLSALSPLLPSLPLTLQSLSSLSAPFLPFPFTCSGVHWDLDRRICSAIQDYQDIVHEWHQVPLKLVRANPRFDFYLALAHFLRVKGVTIREYPCIYGRSVDLFALYNAVHWAGGDAEVTRRGWWPAVYERLRLGGKQGQAADVDYLVEIYRSYFFEWQDSTPPLLDAASRTQPAAEAEGTARADGGKIAAHDAGGEGEGEAGSSEGGASTARKEGGQPVNEATEAGSGQEERQAEGDAEMRVSESKQQPQDLSDGNLEVKQHDAEASGSGAQPKTDLADGGETDKTAERTQQTDVSESTNDVGAQPDTAAS